MYISKGCYTRKMLGQSHYKRKQKDVEKLQASLMQKYFLKEHHIQLHLSPQTSIQYNK